MGYPYRTPNSLNNTGHLEWETPVDRTPLAAKGSFIFERAYVGKWADYRISNKIGVVVDQHSGYDTCSKVITTMVINDHTDFVRYPVARPPTHTGPF